MVAWYRRERHLSQKALALRASALLGRRLGRSNLSLIETGRLLPKMDEVVALAKALEVTPADLYNPDSLRIIQRGG